MLRGSLIDGKNVVLDRDFSKLLEAVSDPGVMSGFNIVAGKLQPGEAFVYVTRANTDSFYCFVENTAEIDVDVTGTKKIWLEVKQASIDDGITNTPDGGNILELKNGASYPTKNFLKIASVVAGVVTDDRYILDNIQDLKQYLQDQLDTHNDRLDGLDADIITMQDDIVALQTGGELTTSIILGENIDTAGIVSLMIDGEIYKYNFGKRTMSNGIITGHTTVKSCFLPNNKIATIGLTTNTITLYIGTIDPATNTITYGAGVVVTTNCDGGFSMCKAGDDSLFVGYSTTGILICGRAVTVSGLVPTIGLETTLRAYDAGEDYSVDFSTYVANGVIALFEYYTSSTNTYRSGTVRICGIAGLIITVGTTAGGLSGANSAVTSLKDMQYVSDNLIAISIHTSSSPYAHVQLISVSGITPTAGAIYGLLNNTIDKIVSDGTYIYVLSAGTTILKLSKSGTILSLVWTATVTAGTGICLIGGMIGVVVGTTIIWHTITDTGLVVRNTVDYGIALTNLYENPFAQAYSIITVSGNPAYIYKIGNEYRNIVGYLSAPGIAGDGGTVLLKGAIIKGLSNIVPGETYYLTRSTLAIGLTGDVVFGRGYSATEIRITYDF